MFVMRNGKGTTITFVNKISQLSHGPICITFHPSLFSFLIILLLQTSYYEFIRVQSHTNSQQNAYRLWDFHLHQRELRRMHSNPKIRRLSIQEGPQNSWTSLQIHGKNGKEEISKDQLPPIDNLLYYYFSTLKKICILLCVLFSNHVACVKNR